MHRKVVWKCGSFGVKRTSNQLNRHNSSSSSSNNYHTHELQQQPCRFSHNGSGQRKPEFDPTLTVSRNQFERLFFAQSETSFLPPHLSTTTPHTIPPPTTTTTTTTTFADTFRPILHDFDATAPEAVTAVSSLSPFGSPGVPYTQNPFHSYSKVCHRLGLQDKQQIAQTNRFLDTLQMFDALSTIARTSFRPERDSLAKARELRNPKHLKLGYILETQLTHSTAKEDAMVTAALRRSSPEVVQLPDVTSTLPTATATTATTTTAAASSTTTTQSTKTAAATAASHVAQNKSRLKKSHNTSSRRSKSTSTTSTTPVHNTENGNTSTFGG